MTTAAKARLTHRSLIQRARTLSSYAARFLEVGPVKDPLIREQLIAAHRILASVIARGEPEPGEKV